MKTKLLSVFVLLAGALVFSSCSKYEEGGPFLGSKKGVLARDWTYDDYEAMGDEDHLADQTGIEDYEETMTFDKEGNYSVEKEYKDNRSGNTFDVSYEADGTWEFVDDQNFIRIVFEWEKQESSNNNNTQTKGVDGIELKIIKLKKDELIVEQSNGGRLTYTAE